MINLTLSSKRHLVSFDTEYQFCYSSGMSTSLRDRKKAKTHKLLGEVALRLFLEKGFAATTIDEIVAEAEVSRSTFFRYLTSKEEAAFPGRAERLARFQAVLSIRQPGESDLGLVRRAFEAFSADYIEHRHLLMAQQRLIVGDTSLYGYQRKLDKLWANAIADAIAGETPQSQLRAQVVAQAVMGAMNAVTDVWFQDQGQGSLLELGKAAFEWLEYGFGRTFRGEYSNGEQ